MGQGRKLALLASSSCVALLMGSGGAFAGACYTGPFPFTNLIAQTCITATSTSFSGNITNATSGTITAGPTAPTNHGITIDNSAINGSIINQGVISAPAGNGIRVINNSAVSGGIGNSGTISASPTGAGVTVTAVSSFGGGISNSGTIVAGDGVFVGFTGLGGLVSTFAGGISNSGTISAGFTAIAVNTGVSVFSGGITNSGTLAASLRGISVFDVGTFGGGINNNGGTINVSTATGISVSGVSTFSGGIANSGTISAANAGISVTNVGLFSQGISNGGVVTGVSGISVTETGTFLGGITNSGTLSATGGFGIVVGSTTPAAGLSTFSGGITSSGTISSVRTGIAVINVGTFSGGITNIGSITTGNTAAGIFVGSTNPATGVSTFTGGITNSGTIASALTGIAVVNVGTFSGGITNLGSITTGTTAAGIFVGSVSTFTGGITNIGTITPGSSAAGIRVDGVSVFTGGIVNSGTIASGSGSGIRVVNVATFSGGIINSGTISGFGGISVGTSCGCAGGPVTSFSGGILNSGTIVARSDGISVVAVSVFSGGITNIGLISAGSFGIQLGGIATFTDGITNTGTINAGFFGIALFDVSNFSGGVTNTGTISAAISGIAVNGFETFAGGITNSGSIGGGFGGITVRTSGAGGGVPTFTGGITNTGTIAAVFTGISVAFAGSFGGGITNAGLITTANRGAGISVEFVSMFTGGITNSGTITGGGVGIEVCGCVGTFTGGVTNSGLITERFAGISIEATSFDGGVLNAGTITGGFTGIAVTSVTTFSGGITNTGTINASSAGILVRSSLFAPAGATFAGGITNTGTIAAGTTGIAVAFAGAYGGGITNAGLISAGFIGISVDAVWMFTGGITNSGTITAGRSGILICNCVGTFAGGITNTGLISAGANGITIEATSFDGHIVNSGTISAGFAINLSNAQNAITIDQNGGLIAGDILFSAFADTLNIRGGTINGNIGGQFGGSTINFSLGAGHTFTYDAAFGFQFISNVNVNSGIVVLNGNNGATNTAINGGVLEVGDAANPHALLASDVDVIGGTLSGHGIVGGAVTIENGGVLFPGGSIGTLTIDGQLTFQPGSTYLVQILPGAGNNSSTFVGGVPATVQINGGNVLALPQLGHYGATSYQIITSNGGINGTFAGVSFAAPFTFTGAASLSSDGLNEFLNLTDGFALFTPTGLNQNQQSVVNGINGAILGGTTPPAQFQNLISLSGPTLLGALSQLSGENGAGFQHGALQAGNQFLSLLLNPYIDGRDNAFMPAIPFAAEARPALPDATLAFAQFVKANPRDATLGSAPQFRVWGAAYGGSGTIDGNAAVGSQRTTASDAAFAAGVDYLLSRDTTFGFALAGGGTNWGLDGGLGNGRSDFFQAGIYARHRFGDAYVAGALSYNFHDVTTTRTVTVAGVDTLQGRFQANGLGARLEGGYHVAVPFVRLTPYGALQVQSIFLPSYGETAIGGSNQFALNYASQTATTTRTELGSWIDRSLLDHGHLWTLYGRVAWAHDFGNSPNATAIFQALPGSNFIVNGAAPNADSALLTVGTKYDLLNGWSFQVKFDGEFSSNASLYSGSGIVRKTW